MKKIAILGYDTVNIGDDIQSFVASTLVEPEYVILRDNYDQVYSWKTGEKLTLKEEVVLIMNGWFMHSPNRDYKCNKIKFPITNSLIRPFYISTCLSLQTQELYELQNLENYKIYQPFFTRDMYTYNNLKSFGINSAFFGCLTQLLSKDSVITNQQNIFKNKTINVDCYTREISHDIPRLKNINPVARIKFAHQFLQQYKNAKKINTSRLHCFLPCRAMGLDVEYVGELDWRTEDLVTQQPDIVKMHDIFYKNLEKLLYE